MLPLDDMSMVDDPLRCIPLDDEIRTSDRPQKRSREKSFRALFHLKFLLPRTGGLVAARRSVLCLKEPPDQGFSGDGVERRGTRAQKRCQMGPKPQNTFATIRIDWGIAHFAVLAIFVAV